MTLFVHSFSHSFANHVTSNFSSLALSAGLSSHLQLTIKQKNTMYVVPPAKLHTGGFFAVVFAY